MSEQQSFAFFSRALRGEESHQALGNMLLYMAHHGETSEEIAGAAKAMRAMMLPFHHTMTHAVDTCGTGGDGLGMFNISTAAAIVAASAGACVVKHGNRSMTSLCGSADLLEAAGVVLDIGEDCARQVLEREHIVFLYAPAFHPALRALAALRRRLKVRTIFNLIGPLCNPGRPRRHLLGVASPDLVPKMASVMQALDFERAYVVHGAEGADELMLSGPNLVRAVGDAPQLSLNAQDAGLTSHPCSALKGGDPAHNLELLRRLLDGEPGPIQDAVLLNAGATLLTAGLCQDLKDALQRVRHAIVSGAAKQKLQRLVELTQRMGKRRCI